MTQDVKNDIKKAIQVNTIPLVAIMTAVTTVLTMFVKIPTPTRGYLNLSDTMIFFSSLISFLDSFFREVNAATKAGRDPAKDSSMISSLCLA